MAGFRHGDLLALALWTDGVDYSGAKRESLLALDLEVTAGGRTVRLVAALCRSDGICLCASTYLMTLPEYGRVRDMLIETCAQKP